MLQSNQPPSTALSTLSAFIQEWQKIYQFEMSTIRLFDAGMSALWSPDKRKIFARVFYHLRGNFHDFLWYIGNHAKNSNVKQIVMENILEEFSLNGRSHELLYHDFASELGVNILDEITKKVSYLDFARDFNHQHIVWLAEHDSDSGFAAFSAYEKLDNIDYHYLYDLVASFNLPRKALTFFEAHRYVNHFDVTQQRLSEIWVENCQKVKSSFMFIGQHQLNMWRNLCRYMCQYE